VCRQGGSAEPRLLASLGRMRRLLISSALLAALGTGTMALRADDSGAAPASISIAGGTPAAAGAYPWQAALISSQAPQRPNAYQRYFFCGGTLIEPRRILTAAHCVVGVNPGQIDVLVGGLRMNNPEMKRIHVSRIAADPNYNLRTSNPGSDVAILRLARPVPAIAPLPLISGAEAGTLAPGSPVRAVGWGQTSAKSTAPLNILRQADLRLVPDSRCTAVYSKVFHPGTQLCAGGTPGKGSCFGDSGGPLLVDDGAGGWRELGVVNAAASCVTDRFPQLYARVSALRGFALSTSPVYAAVNLRRPSIRGHFAVGSLLRCRRGAWSGRGVHFLYLWASKRRGHRSFSVIDGEDHRTMRLAQGDMHSRVVCLVGALNAGGLGIALSAPVHSHR
jgi:secreted trypsin-like serine protease